MAVLWDGRTCIFVHSKADVLSTQSTGVDRVKLLIMHRLCLIGQLVSPFGKHIYIGCLFILLFIFMLHLVCLCEFLITFAHNHEKQVLNL